MNCKKCGNVLNETDVICPACGEPVNPPVPLTSPVQNVVNPVPTAAPLANTDIAINPNALNNQNLGNQSLASTPSQAMNNESVATPMANADIAVNPNVVVEPSSSLTGAPAQPGGLNATNEAPTVQTPLMPASNLQNQTTVPEAPAVSDAANTSAVKPKKKVDVKFIIIVTVLLILIAGLGAFIIYKLM